MKVSVIIPCLDVEAYIGACLESVWHQKHPDVEVIVVDDGSTDATVQRVKLAAAGAGRHILLMTGEHRGASAARNRGLQEATGEMVQFLDADDLLLPDKLSAQAAIANDNEVPDLIVGDYLDLLPGGSTRIVHALYGRPWMGLIATKLGTTSANLWRRTTLMRMGGWDEQLASSQDYALMFRLLQHGGGVSYDPVVRTHVLKRTTGSISRTGVKDNWLRYIDLRLRIREHLRTSHAPDLAEERNAVDQYLFMAIHVIAKEDLPLASKLYLEHIPLEFVPVPSAAITRRYAWAHRLLGFERAMRLGKFLGN